MTTTTNRSSMKISRSVSEVTSRVLFGRVIADEAHKLKSPKTRISFSVRLLRASTLIFLSGTPMMNRVQDLVGFLELIWKPSFVNGQDTLDLEDFRAACDAAVGGTLTTRNLNDYLHLLNPTSFRKLTTTPKGSQLSPHVAHLILPPILKILQLRRTMAGTMMVNGELMRIGAQIPPYKVMTVELEMNPNARRVYGLAHNSMLSVINF